MALPVSLGVLVVVGLLGSVAIETSARANHVTGGDSNRKLALEAADAGLAVATYRLNMLRPDDSHCVTTSVQSPDGNGLCPIDGPETLGNGSTFTFQVTTKLTNGTCAGLEVDNSSQPVSDRCVTATGTANGVSARTQQRVAAWQAQPFFPVAGLVGLNGVTIAQNAHANGAAGTNKVLTINNNASVTGAVLGPGGSVVLGTQGSSDGTVAQQTTPLGAPAVPVGNSATSNLDYRITNGLTGTTPYDSTSGATWDATNRMLSFSNNGSSITFGAGAASGVYNFCNFVTGNKTVINVANGAKVTIIIDSPGDPNSGVQGSATNPPCPTGSGNLNLGNNVTINDYNTHPAATDLQFYVYGNGTNVEWGNGTSTNAYATIFAPNSTVDMNNVGNFYGAVSANKVNMNNVGLFTWDGSASTLVAQVQGLFYRTSWQQCPAAPTSSNNLSSGC
jgi:Tfp pilus assembly protein PilX